MKVYILILDNFYEPSDIAAVYKDEQTADSKADELNASLDAQKSGRMNYSVEEFDVKQ